MTEKRIQSEIEYRMAKWIAYNVHHQKLISTEEYKKACADFLLRFGPPTSCFEEDEDNEN